MPRASSAAAVRPAATPTHRSVSSAVPGDAPIAVLALGNALMGDDGFGPTTLALLEEHWRWPPSVALLDLARAGADLAAQLRGRRHVILLGAVQSDARPGTVVSWGKAALLSPEPARAAAGLEPHEPGIRSALVAAEAAGDAPDDALLVGVVPYALALGTAVSPLVELACRIAAIEVVRRVRGWGAEVREAPSARLWWKPAPA